MAAVVVGSLVAQIEDELEAVVDTIGDRIRAEIPDFRRLPSATLASAVRGNVSRALAALRDLRDPTPEELELRRRGRPRAGRAGPDRRRGPARLPDLDHRRVVALRRARARPGRRRRHRAGVQRDAVALGRRRDGRGRRRAPRGRARAGARGAAAPRRVRVRAAHRDARTRTSCGARARRSGSTPNASTSRSARAGRCKPDGLYDRARPRRRRDNPEPP